MKNSLKLLLLVSVATAYAPMASAQSSATEARLEALEAMVNELKAELAAEKAQTDSDLILLEEKAATIPAPVKSTSSGGTNFKISGFVDFDAHITNLSDGPRPTANRLDRDFFIPSLIPTSDGSGESSTFTDFTARSSRFRLHGDREVNGEKLTGLFELDFLTTNDGNQRVTSSFSPRLRRAFVDYKGFRVGQEWSTFQNLSSIPESASFYVLPEGQVFQRQAQIRYTNGPFQIALENANATVTDLAGARIEADGNTIPDIVARYNLKGDFGNISFSGIYRQLRLPDFGLADDTATGIGASVSGRVNVGAGNIRFGVTGGDGIGRYIGLNAINGAIIDPGTNELEAISSIGGHVALQYPVTENSRFNIGYSGLFVDNEFTNAIGAIETGQSGYAAYMWDVAPKMTVGVEGLYGTSERENGNDGDLTRFTFSTRYNF